MKKLKQEDSQSKDILADNIARLKQLFPEVFAEDRIDFDALKQVLGEYVEDRDERYSFTWNGKSRAKRLAQSPSTGTLRPAPEESVNWDSTKNLFIEGDNLEVLKLLQKSYHKKVKMIYIDPPYNTGGEFIYKDDYRDNLKNYLAITGQVDREGRRYSTSAETSGRYHTDWLNMMYPRLKLARNLLRDDGVIFISIDDHEVANLRKICDEIFGDENFVANLIWEKKFSPQNDAKWFSDNHDHILVFAKNKENWSPQKIKRSETSNSRYANPDNDARGPWASSDMTVKTYNPNYDYEIETPSGKIISPTKGRCWAVSKERFQELVADNRVWFGEKGQNVPRYKTFLSEVDDGIVPLTIWKYSEVGHNQGARQETKKIFNNNAYFDGPKPTKLIKKALTLSTNNNDIVCDFFSGSCASAHAILDLNKEDSGKRKFIMVQIPEPCDENSEACKAGYSTIAEIGKERIRRVISEIKNENPQYNGDLGFKVLKLDASNIRPWNVDPDNLEKSILDMSDNIRPERSEQDVLYELLLKYGLDLTIPIEQREVAGKKVHIIGAGALVICLDKEISLEVVEAIADLKEKLSPELMRVVFKDSGFKDDVVKTNAVQILRQKGIEDVRSL